MKVLRLLVAFFAIHSLCAVDLDQGYITISEKLDRFNALLNDQQLDAEIKREKLIQIVESIVDFETITRTALGPYASELTSEQNERFSAAFKTTLQRWIIDDLMRFENEKITLSEYVWLPGEEKVLVRVLGRERSGLAVNNRDRQRSRTEYILKEREEKWKITDLTINGVNIARNYRSQIDGLMGRGKSAEKMIDLFEEIASGR